MSDNSETEALHIMIAAQGLLIEHLWANIFANLDGDEARRIKDALIESSGNSIAAYTGGPKDVEQIQNWGLLVQNHMRSLIDSISRREEDARKQRDPAHPG